MNNKILVIDDDSAVRDAFRLILEDDGFCVDEAEDGLSGIERVMAERPDLIFLDLRMPGIDGVETMRRLKQLDAGLIIYIVTAFANEYMEQLKIAYAEGLEFQLASKPLTSTQIRHIARSVRRMSETDQEPIKLSLTLYVVSVTDEIKDFIERLETALAAAYGAAQWSLDVIEVLSMPEKALSEDIFATPMLVRNLPTPVMKLLGDIMKIPQVLAAISAVHANSTDTVIM